MSDLIVHLESAERGSVELDRAVWCATGGWLGVDYPPSYTSNVNTALALIETQLGDCWVWNGGSDVRCWAHLWNDTPTYNGVPVSGFAKTFALAVCAAVLRAKAQISNIDSPEAGGEK